MLGTEQRVLDAIDVDGMLEYLCELLSIPSTGGEENAAQENVAAKLEGLGLEVEFWEVDFATIRDHPSFSMAIEREEGLGVVGVTGGCGEGRSLILNGHIDVVSAGDESNWSHAPWKGTIADGRVYGRTGEWAPSTQPSEDTVQTAR
jgi:acetylornithine deacetylase